jgi:hypothetical protein
MSEIAVFCDHRTVCAGCSTSSWKAAQWEQDDDATCKRSGGDYNAPREADALP